MTDLHSVFYQATNTGRRTRSLWATNTGKVKSSWDSLISYSFLQLCPFLLIQPQPVYLLWAKVYAKVRCRS